MDEIIVNEQEQIIKTNDITKLTQEVTENTPEADATETIERVNVALSEPETVQVLSAFEPLGEQNEQLNHALLNGRENANQHPISAITGLTDELSNIKALKTVLSNGKNLAQYYLWDGAHANSVGKFVSFVSGTNKIRICDGTSDEIFGVIVQENDMGFVGGKLTTAQNDYGLVCFSGDVRVVCSNDVATGDRVLPNTLGIANKGSSGYKVISTVNDGGVLYAIINLSINGQILAKIDSEVYTLNQTITANNDNVTRAINAVNTLATAASNKADDASDTAEQASEDAQGAVTKSDQAYDIAEDAQTDAALAKEIAQSAVTAAETARNTAVATANSAVASVNTLVQTLEPITTYGASQLIYTIQNDLATNVELQAVSDDADEALTATIKNAKDLKTLATVTKKYTVGEYPQSEGLTQAEATATLKAGMVFVPIANYPPAPAETLFYKDYSYVWNGSGWDQSQTANVAFSQTYITGGGSALYWYCNAVNDITEDNITYETNTLYLWETDHWTAVATLAENSLARVTSMINQKANEIKTEVVNARGSYASMSARITADEAVVSSTAAWKSDVESDVANIATIQQTANDASASVALVVSGSGSNKSVNAASIVTAINESGSTVLINANKIQLDGTVYVTKSELQGSGTTVINGGNITTGTIDASIVTVDNINASNIKSGTIQSTNYVADTIGMKINLSTGVIDSKNFKVSATGDITATGGTIGAWNIGYPIELGSGYSGALYSVVTDSDDNKDITFLRAGNDKNNWAYGVKHYDNQEQTWSDIFYIRMDGYINATMGKIGGCNITNGTLYVTNANIAGQISGGKIDTDSLTAKKLLVKDGNTTLLDAGVTASNKVSIGGWSVGSDSLYSEDGLSSDTTYRKASLAWTGVYLQKKSDGVTYHCSLRAPDNPSYKALFVGGTDGVGNNAPFYVKLNGEMHTSNIVATGGTIGPLSVSENELIFGTEDSGRWQGVKITKDNNSYGTIQSKTMHAIDGKFGTWFFNMEKGFWCTIDDTITIGDYYYTEAECRLADAGISIYGKKNGSGNLVCAESCTWDKIIKKCQ